MSQTNIAPSSSASSASSASSLQSRMGTLVVIPWAGPHAEDGRDMAFLMAYSLGDGSQGPQSGQEAVLEAAAEIGLPVGGAILDVATAQKPPVKVLVEGGKAVLTMPYLHANCPVPPEWATAARARGSVYVILASRPWPEAVPGAALSEERLRAYAADEGVLTSAAHCLVPVTTLNRS